MTNSIIENKAPVKLINIASEYNLDDILLKLQDQDWELNC